MAVADRALYQQQAQQHASDMQQLEISQVDIGKKSDDDENGELESGRMLLPLYARTQSRLSAISNSSFTTGTERGDDNCINRDLYAHPVIDEGDEDMQRDDDDDDDDEADDTFIIDKDNVFPRMPTISYHNHIAHFSHQNDREIDISCPSHHGMHSRHSIPFDITPSSIHQSQATIPSVNVHEHTATNLSSNNLSANNLNTPCLNTSSHLMNESVAFKMQQIPNPRKLQPMTSTLLTPRGMKSNIGITASAESTMTGQTIRPHLGMSSANGFSIFYDDTFEATYGSATEQSPIYTMNQYRTRNLRGKDSLNSDLGDDGDPDSDEEDLENEGRHHHGTKEEEDLEEEEGQFQRNSMRQSLRTSNTLRTDAKWNGSQWFKQHRVLLLSTLILCALTSALWVVIDSATLHRLLLTIYLTVFVISEVLMCRTLWIVVSALLSMATQRKWSWCCYSTSSSSSMCQRVIFCVNHSGFYIWWSFLSLSVYSTFLFLIHWRDSHHFGRLLDTLQPWWVEALKHSFECAVVLCLGLFVKTLLIRWICLKYYLAGNLRKIKKMVRCEKYLKILLRNKSIFSMKTRQFLDINGAALAMQSEKSQTVAFRLDVLFLQSEFNLYSNYMQNNEVPNGDQLVNTLTSSAIFNCTQKEDALSVQSCILWLYNSKTDRVAVIDDNELDKICKFFAKYIVCSVTKNRVHSAPESPIKRRPGFAAMQHMFEQQNNEYDTHNDGGMVNVVEVDDDDGNENEDDDGDGALIEEAPKTPQGAGKRGGDGRGGGGNGIVIGGGAGSGGGGLQFVSQSLMNEARWHQMAAPKSPENVRKSATSITESEFMECFTRHGRTRLGIEAWKDMNVSEQELTKKELQRWLYSYLHSLIFLKQALSSYPELLSNLDISSNVFLLFAMFLVFLLIFGVEFTDSIATYASTVAIFAVFGRNVFTQFFDAIYLIFVLSPFEVGDTIVIDGERFTVNAIYIMSTEMITAVSRGNIVVTKANSSLMGKDIHNLSRTKNPYHHITFYVSQNTTTQQLAELKKRIDCFIRTKMQSDIRDTWFVLQGVDKECRMNISLFLGSIYSFSDNNAMWRQIHVINKEIREYVTSMGIQYKRFSEQDVRLMHIEGPVMAYDTTQRTSSVVGSLQDFHSIQQQQQQRHKGKLRERGKGRKSAKLKEEDQGIY